MIRILLNGQQSANEPDGISDATDRMFYDPEWFGYRREINVDLSFFGEDFTRLYGIFKESTCNEINVEVHETDSDTGPWQSLFKGLIYSNDITFDIDRRIAKTQVIDNGFVARIINYADLPINIFSPITKNGEPISITTQSVDIHDHLGNTYTRTVITQFNLLDYLIRYLTDNAVELDSDFLMSAPANKYYFVSGNVLRNMGAVYPELKIGPMLKDLCKLWAMRWVIIENSGQLKFKLEPITFFSTNASSSYIDGFANFTIKSNDSLLVSDFTFGSYKQTTSEADDTDAWLVSELLQPWSAHTGSTISADGSCAVRNSLNLSTTTIIYDTNTISAALNAGTEKTFDEDIFLTNSTADVWYTNTGILKPLNNYDITVSQQLKRWLDEYCFSYPKSVASCDSLWEGDGNSAILSSPLSVIIDNPIVSGCYWTGADLLHNGNANGFVVEIHLELFFDPDDNVVTSGNVVLGWDYSAIQFMKPFSGWTNIGPSFGDYVTQVSKDVLVNETVVYSATFYDIYLDTNIPLTLIGGTNGPILRITSNSYIKIYHNSFQSFVQSDCRRPAYEVSAEGFSSASNARILRANRFDNYIMPNSFRAYTGTIFELQRNITSGKTSVKLLAKNV